MAKKQKIIIIDGNALVHRAFHALPPTMTTKDGVMTNAVYGFVTILFKVLKDLKPQYGVVTFDLAKKTFRHKKYSAYKAKRKKQPDELYAQFPIVKEIVRALNIPIYEQEGYEADDLIGTLTQKLDGSLEKYIVTGDMDTLQLVDDHTFVYTMKKGVKDTIIYDKAAVKERFQGLTVDQMIDYKSLRGDPSDNIPGVRGIGEKGAINLLTEYKTLDNIYKNIEKIKGANQKKLIEHKEEAYLSQYLATIKRDISIKIKLSDCLLSDYKTDEVFKVLQKYDFKSLLNQLTNVPQLQPQQSLFGNIEEKQDYSKDGYHLIDDAKKFESFLVKLKKQTIFALDTETTSLNFMTNKLVGLSFSWAKDEAYYIDVFNNPDLLAKELVDILEDPKINKIGQNIKFDYHSLDNSGVNLKGISFDTMIASYLLNPGTRQHSLDKLAFSELGHQMMSFEALCGKGKAQILITDVPLDKLSYYACEDADITWQLYEKLAQQIKDTNSLEQVLEKIEVPLIGVLGTMERNGVLLDQKFLVDMQVDLSDKITSLEKNIYKEAGQEFNIASPKQLKEILFEKLAISSENIKKGKTGLSTAAAELNKMRDAHPIIPLIEEYRELAKLQNTYVEALPKLVNEKTRRIHTSFNQVVTATGRLSSSDPNLQNIPIRTDLGKKIRQAFIAPKEHKLVAIDYSQVELRMIAHLSGDKKMLAAFNNDQDIHQSTADEMGVTRRQAKAINFGVIYGMGVYGLAQSAETSREQASQFLEEYFVLYKDLDKYLDETKEFARKQGYVQTLFGRVRRLPDIHSSIFQIRNAAERMAINMPAQGTSADILKMAMLKIQEAIDLGDIKAKMILQVHDELVFEIKSDIIKEETRKIKDIMEHIYKLECPLKADVSIGDNWGKLKDI